MRRLNGFSRHEARVQIVAALIPTHVRYRLDSETLITDANDIIEELEKAAAADAVVDRAEWEEQERTAFKANCGVAGNEQKPAPEVE